MSLTRRQSLAWIGGAGAASLFAARAAAVVQPLEWRIGAVRVRRFHDRDCAPLDPTRFFPDANPATMAAIPWLHPWFADLQGRITLAIAAYLVESRGRRILVDTGLGRLDLPGFPLLPRPGPELPEALTAAGIAPETIDIIVNTHLHADHVGGNVRALAGGPRPAFARARYLVHRRERDFWAARPPDSFGRSIFAAAVQPLADAGQLDLVEGTEALTEEVALVPSPGHTPGHMSVRIVSRGREGLISGDILHHPVQLAFPDRGMDQDEVTAAASRRSLLSRLADRGGLLIGSHFPAPTAGRVERAGAAFRFSV